MYLKLSASGWFLFNFIIDDARSREREILHKLPGILYLASELSASQRLCRIESVCRLCVTSTEEESDVGVW
jgi:hypothetical protein